METPNKGNARNRKLLTFDLIKARDRGDTFSQLDEKRRVCKSDIRVSLFSSCKAAC